VHVLHLIPNWQDVVREIFRVVARSGPFVIDQGAVLRDADIHRAFLRAIGLTRRHVGLEGTEPLLALLPELGATEAEAATGALRPEWTPAAILHNLAENRYSWTWRIDEATRRRGVEAATAWARDELGDIHAPRVGEATITVRVFTLP